MFQILFNKLSVTGCVHHGLDFSGRPCFGIRCTCDFIGYIARIRVVIEGDRLTSLYTVCYRNVCAYTIRVPYFVGIPYLKLKGTNGGVQFF